MVVNVRATKMKDETYFGPPDQGSGIVSEKEDLKVFDKSQLDPPRLPGIRRGTHGALARSWRAQHEETRKQEGQSCEVEV